MVTHHIANVEFPDRNRAPAPRFMRANNQFEFLALINTLKENFMSICKYCNTERPSKAMGVHVLTCRSNPKHAEYKEKRKRSKQIEYDDFKVICHNCETIFLVNEPIEKFPKKDKYFCGKFCASSNNGKIKKNKQFRKKTDKVTSCAKCNKEMVNIRRKYCSDECMKLSRKNINRSYRHLCRFRFEVTDFPEEFDLKMIAEHGWYAPTNSIKRAPNINGVSKDHKFSVSDGEKYSISPDIIGHPANCQILINSDNISKHKNLL